ncbi:HTH domain-containing protein [Tetragenococcus koreensis]|uniref:BglG family transcription antiterminator n=2 Tax=Tetragenococcus koreensis TaxID=290335 RepID=UPI001F2AADCF|nr:HTH domain-containing protein [Tetragenococcus koreensis]MCF1619165.1 HTH domain-containing protein [Tetragenococcus koreensis]MCF1656647.1 HTH domain-containing protein [Tetragenococcus koreensis]
MAVVNRWYQILQLLVTRKEMTTTELEQKLTVSRQTIRNSIVSLNEELADIAKIKQKDNTYQLIINNFDRFDEVMVGGLKQTRDFNSANKRISFMIKRLIESGNFIAIDDLSEELGVSRGTAANDIKEMKQMVCFFNVKVSGTPNRGMHIYGNEFDLRLLYIYHVQDYFTDNFLQAETYQLVDEIAQMGQVPKMYTALLKKTISTVIKRVKGNCLIEAMPEGYLNYTQNHQAIETLIYHLELSYEITLSQNEKDFICFPLSLSSNELKNIQDINEKELEAYFEKMMDYIHKTLVVDLDEKKLFIDMKYHLMYLINRLLFRFEVQDLFYGEVEKQYPFAYELAKVGLSRLENELNRNASSVEISYLALYFELAIRKQTDKTVQKEIAIVCSTGRGTALIIQRQIEKVVGSEIKITHYSEEEYKKQDLNQYFAIFSTIPLKNVDQSTPVIQLSNLFNTEWLRDEWERVNEIHSKSFENIIFRFTKLDHQKTYDTNLKQMIRELTLEKMVDAQFEQRVFEREDKHTTIYEAGVAFPHTINKASDQVILSLGVFQKEALKTPAGKVELILLLAIPETLSENDESELLKLYDFVFAFVGNQQLRKELCHLDNVFELKTWMKRRFLS